jgi:hypothetical protein
VFSVVAGGIGTLVVVGLVAAAWPEVRRLGKLEEATPHPGDPLGSPVQSVP